MLSRPGSSVPPPSPIPPYLSSLSPSLPISQPTPIPISVQQVIFNLRAEKMQKVTPLIIKNEKKYHCINYQELKPDYVS